LILCEDEPAIVDYVGTWVGMPQSVSELEDVVDETAGTDRWVSGGPPTLEAMREARIEPNSQQPGEILLYAVKEGKAQAVGPCSLQGHL
jgi:hypothetical protein